MSEAPAKRQRTTAEHVASKAVDGYFANDAASTASNAQGEPRIVLADNFGKVRPGVHLPLTPTRVEQAPVCSQLVPAHPGRREAMPRPR